mmetsp:Transcript_2433/g.3916  ORF Transcript_2433/g.3916 Transcript_2433/m.3916 type:complete len:116 (-) Transcript_2433:1452-1799(-)
MNLCLFDESLFIRLISVYSISSLHTSLRPWTSRNATASSPRGGRKRAQKPNEKEEPPAAAADQSIPPPLSPLSFSPGGSPPAGPLSAVRALFLARPPSSSGKGCGAEDSAPGFST